MAPSSESEFDSEATDQEVGEAAVATRRVGFLDDDADVSALFCLLRVDDTDKRRC